MYSNKLNIVFVIFFLFTGYNITFSQSKLKIGFDIRDEYVHETYANIKGLSSSDKYFELPAVDFLASYNLSKNYSLELNAGYEFLYIIIPDGLFVGSNFGISAIRNLFNNWVYGRLNLTMHFNHSGGHDAMTGGDKSIESVFPTIGLGVDIYTSENISFNLMFVKLLKEKIAYSFDYGDDEKGNIIEKRTGEYKRPYFIQFGFSFYWDIL